jgi:hypothetical protein
LDPRAATIAHAGRRTAGDTKPEGYTVVSIVG